LGLLAGYGTKLTLILVTDDLAWEIMCGGSIVLSSIVLISVLVILPESPRWLVLHGHFEEAKSVFSKVYPPGEYTAYVFVRATLHLSMV